MDKRKIRIKELNKKIQEVSKRDEPFIAKRNELQSEIDTEANQKLLGKCFKFRNSYGSGEEWWLYTKIVEVDNWSVTVITVQDCNEGRIEIKRENHSASHYQKDVGSQLQITQEEFDKNFEEILEKIKKS